MKWKWRRRPCDPSQALVAAWCFPSKRWYLPFRASLRSEIRFPNISKSNIGRTESLRGAQRNMKNAPPRRSGTVGAGVSPLKYAKLISNIADATAAALCCALPLFAWCQKLFLVQRRRRSAAASFPPPAVILPRFFSLQAFHICSLITSAIVFFLFLNE